MPAAAVTGEDPAARTERLRRRLKAARAIAGLTVPQLAAELKRRGYTRGYSPDNIGLMERGQTPIQPQTIPVLAAACGVSPAFFSVDLATLQEESTTEALERRLAAVEAALSRLLEEDAPPAPSDEIVPPVEADETSPGSGRDGVSPAARGARRGRRR